MPISPNLSAIMCDGMGWFTENDYKRMLLTYDEVYYLLPKDLVQFKDERGKTRSLYFPFTEKEDYSFKVHYLTPDNNTIHLILDAAKADLANPQFNKIVDGIPEIDRIYSWTVVNVDGDLGEGRSIELGWGQEHLAHAILLNKFLLAASSLGCIPISGKSYIHGLISEKYRFCVENLRITRPELLPVSLREGVIKNNPIVDRIVSALVSNEELEMHSEMDIVNFKERNKKLFEQYSFAIRKLVGNISALPISGDFDAQVNEMIGTEVWKEKAEIERELSSAWQAIFRSAVKSSIGSIVGVGISPFLSLGQITLGSVIASTLAVTPWAVSEFIKFTEARERVQEHGLYYLMKFSG